MNWGKEMFVKKGVVCTVADKERKETEKELWKSIISPNDYLDLDEWISLLSDE